VARVCTTRIRWRSQCRPRGCEAEPTPDAADLGSEEAASKAPVVSCCGLCASEVAGLCQMVGRGHAAVEAWPPSWKPAPARTGFESSFNPLELSFDHLELVEPFDDLRVFLPPELDGARRADGTRGRVWTQILSSQPSGVVKQGGGVRLRVRPPPRRGCLAAGSPRTTGRVALASCGSADVTCVGAGVADPHTWVVLCG
jgi:hypothetical protein